MAYYLNIDRYGNEELNGGAFVNYKIRSSGGITPPVNTATKVINTSIIESTGGSEWSIANSEFTASVAGWYGISGQIALGGSWAAVDWLQLGVYKNGSVISAWQDRVEAGVSTNMRVHGYTTTYLAVGDKITFQITSAKANPMATNSLLNEFTISKLY